MLIPQHILDTVTQFHETYRHPQLPRPEASGIYLLFPSEISDMVAEHGWPATWPNADRPGVYFIFGPRMQLLYIGKASWLGRRLSTYFQYLTGRGSECKIVHSGWKTRPSYVATVALNKSFEAAALEEYLIGVLNPEENALWVSRPE